MKKAYYVLFLVLFCTYAAAQEEKVLINGHHFKFVQTVVNDTLQADFIEIYKSNKKIITHTHSHFDGDCSSENIELGTYQIKENTIFFYTYWASGDRMNKNIYPYGFRKQTYKVANNGKVTLRSSIIYVKDYVDAYAEHKGMQFLDTVTNSANDQKLLNDYVSKVEEMYSSKFVFGKQKETLEKEVRTLLKNEIKENTGYWKEVYGDNCNK
ncbi:hypothetical protein JBL43_16515 [Aureibaculum sp. A20]|uniref:DUF4468 domain-containing protein n=1 Tax=Aureibaculum flavum TaxID=2795986 RepID=A0ABS0WV49_9FLAO|nr:hypothetical protein [Aureibaculum flavum]MBJ2175859.1 hypothetical protein [Aureibaculum flavum]